MGTSPEYPANIIFDHVQPFLAQLRNNGQVVQPTLLPEDYPVLPGSVVAVEPYYYLSSGGAFGSRGNRDPDTLGTYKVTIDQKAHILKTIPNPDGLTSRWELNIRESEGSRPATAAEARDVMHLLEMMHEDATPQSTMEPSVSQAEHQPAGSESSRRLGKRILNYFLKPAHQ